MCPIHKLEMNGETPPHPTITNLVALIFWSREPTSKKIKPKNGKIRRSQCENSVLSIMHSEAGTRYISNKPLPSREGTRAERVKRRAEVRIMGPK